MPHRFPLQVALRDGRRLLVRPFTERDTGPLYEFFQHLPAEVRRFAWDNIENRGLIEAWGKNLDYGKVLPLLAFDGQKIVADATLHRRDGGPLRRAGRIKWLIDPDYRGQGLGSTLVNTFVTIAREQGLRHLVTLLIADAEADAIATLRDLGFSEWTLPGYGTDPDGNAHDMVMMVLKV